MSEAIAIGFGDLHLTLQQPACRADKDWMKVQANYLAQVQLLSNELGNIPILFAGDLFDRWNPSPELINFALQYLPNNMICVPGQHDLPNHRIEDMDRSGYGVLRRAGKIENIAGKAMGTRFGFTVYGAGWNQYLGKHGAQASGGLHIAIIHRYLWIPGKGYPDAPETSQVKNQPDPLGAYDVIISGDNHTYFTAQSGSATIFNSGTFIRRKSDEHFHKPCVGIIYSDGTVKRRLLGTSKDLFHEDVEDRKEVPLDMKTFIDNLEKLGEQGVDFRQAVKQHLEKEEIPEQTKQIILTAIE